MGKMTIDDLRRILVECAGEDEATELGADAIDTDFDDLGYDSLALMETAARIRQELGVVIPDDQVVELRTPRQVLDAVNGAAVETA
ncbi:acyl carrier protein [Saccharopolyspora oryzae]|uniref:Acyl carrier protein n=1 Tax=Saccharopolyspora oryzae TaxID=2997343 RepID=A0ABT4USL7_9PSEU|nr:acyl carrier protein [Saccharopolyspora oryzae]MDA3624711.1 acyl carrier protein [Saccharopolyspora oryzae]